MLLSRLLAFLLVLGVLVGLTLSAAAQDKDKDKPAKDKDAKKEEKKDKDKDDKKEKDKDDKKAGGTKLEWKFKQGEAFYQTMVTDTEQKMKVMNNDVIQKQKQTFHFKWTPSKVEGDKIDIDQEILGVVMEIEIGGTKISYDSTKADQPNNPLGDFFRSLIGAKFTFTLDKKDYKVSNVAGREAFLNKLTTANPGMRQLLETILSDQAMKDMAEPTFGVVKADPVKDNEKWKRETKLDMGPIGKYDNTYEYTYEGMDAGSAEKHKIAVTTTLNYTPPDEKSVAQGGLPFKIKSASLKSKNPIGRIVFNNVKGRVDKAEVSVELNGDLQIEIGGQQTKVELSQKQTSTTTTSDTDPTKAKK